MPSLADDADSGPVATVQRFILDLIACYRRVQSAPQAAGLDAATVTQQLASLWLAESAIRLGQPTERPRQLAVIGPTQVGKSTIVNLLIGRSVAEVSPLAGFTVHPQGFWISSDDAMETWAEGVFRGWRRCETNQLSRDELETYALDRLSPSAPLANEPAVTSASAALPACVVWDTPDFDSLSATDYQRGVLEAAALADVYLLVLSAEKYSDLSVWNMLQLLEPLGRPLAICLNKLSPDCADVVESSLRQRLGELAQGWGDVPIVPVAFCAGLGASGASGSLAANEQLDSSPLVTAVVTELQRGRRQPDGGAGPLVRCHWDAWTAPVRAEHVAIEEWHRQVEAGLEGFLERYRRDYLDHPHRYDAFRRAAIELLHLLEIPKLSGWITKARHVATWPVRQIWAAGRAWRSSGHSADAAAARLGAEATVLYDAMDELLGSLQRDLDRRRDSTKPGFAVWRTVGQRLQGEEAQWRAAFHSALEAHHAQVTREIQAVANNLYEQLQRQPARLAALRTARATIDVGGLLLAVKTGGLTPVDALWAPATFALSSLLMESIAGVQMHSTARQLKKRQYEAVQQTLAEQLLGPELRSLADNRPPIQPPSASEGPDRTTSVSEGLFGIPVEQLAAADEALGVWEQRDVAAGLRPGRRPSPGNAGAAGQ